MECQVAKLEKMEAKLSAMKEMIGKTRLVTAKGRRIWKGARGADWIFCKGGNWKICLQLRFKPLKVISTDCTKVVFQIFFSPKILTVLMY
jgi:hypothetical protein